MCGIAGMIALDHSPSDVEAAVTRMTAALAHRGPDGHGVHAWHGGGLSVALGHRRLSIIDLSDEAAQPFVMKQNSAQALTYNGEIYNYRDLMDARVRARSPIAERSDTATLAVLFALDGIRCVPRLQGIFAFAVWQPSERRLTLARDHFGVKPLYWSRVGQSILFASEVRALLASGMVERRLEPRALASLLEFGAPTEPLTIVRGVQSLAPGATMTIDDQLAVREEQYWRLYPRDTPAEPESIANELARSVRSQLLADVPVGIFLSGGIDSTALAIAAQRSGAAACAISLFFEGSADSEEVQVRETARHLGLALHSSMLSSSSAAEALLSWMEAQDQPSVDGLNTYLVSRVAKEASLKVALSGLGGDEIFGGYEGYRRSRQWLQAGRWLRPLRWPVQTSVRRMRIENEKASRVIDVISGALSPYHASRAMRGMQAIAALLRARPVDAALTLEAASLAASFDAEPVLMRRLALLESTFYMRNVLLRDADQMGMSSAIEIRVPLLDPRLAEIAVSALGDPPSRGAMAKPLLVGAIADPLLTQLAAERKRGFSLPLNSWLRSPRSRSMFGELIGGSAKGFEVFRPGVPARVLERFDARRCTAYHLLSIVTTGMWLYRHGVSE
jgi:asparagine synthase (glutamine-hydrolysing)